MPLKVEGQQSDTEPMSGKNGSSVVDSPFTQISPRPNIMIENKPGKPTKEFIAVKPTSVNMTIEKSKHEESIAEVKKPQETAKPRKRSTRNE